MKDNYIFQAWLVLLLSVGFGSALAGVKIALQGRIDENKRNETYSQIPKLVQGADQAATKEFVTGDEDAKIAYKAFSASGEHLGWVIKAAGAGFADKIELLIGLDAKAERILGMYVLDQKETPALGDRIRENTFRDKFMGLSAARPIEVVKAPASASLERNEIQSISGATVSSLSVSSIVNKAVAEFRLKMGGVKPAAAGDSKE